MEFFPKCGPYQIIPFEQSDHTSAYHSDHKLAVEYNTKWKDLKIYIGDDYYSDKIVSKMPNAELSVNSMKK